MSAVFVLGREGRLEVGDSVVEQPASEYRDFYTGKKRTFPAHLRVKRGGSLVSLTVPSKRGVAVEGAGFYARVLPEDAEAGLAELDREIERKRDELTALHKARQDYLAAHIVRGERISKKHVAKTEGTGRRTTPA